MELTKRIEQNVRERMRDFQKHIAYALSEYNMTVRACVITATFVSAIMLIFFVIAMNMMESSYAVQISQLKTEQNSYNAEVQLAHSKELSVLTSKYEEELQDLHDQIDAKDALIAKLQSEQYDDYQNVSYLMDKYDYVFSRMSDTSGITIDDIAYYDNMCKENNWNPHIMWCIYWNESNFTAVIDNPISSARGLGQILYSTAKSMYENILCLGIYDHSMAYDTKTNMMLTTHLLFRNIDQGLAAAIALYSNDSTGSYYNLVCKNARDFGVDISITTYQ